MTNYKRFITYLYYYDAGKKMGNVGFARVETSDELGKVTIHCSTKVDSTKTCKVYLLKRTKSMTISKQVATASSQNGNLDIKLTFEEGKVNGSEFSLKDTHGVVILYSKDNYIAAKWDGSSVSYHEVILLEQEEEIQQPIPKVEAAQVVKSEEKVIEIQPKVVMMNAADIVNMGKASDIAKVTEQKEPVEEKTVKGHIVEESILEGSTLEENIVEGSIVTDNTIFNKILDNITGSNKTADSKTTNNITKDSKAIEDSTKESILGESKAEGNADESIVVESVVDERKVNEGKLIENKIDENKITDSNRFNQSLTGNRNAVNRGFERNNNAGRNHYMGRNMRSPYSNLQAAQVVTNDNNVEKKEEEVKKSIKDIIRENIRAEKEKESNKEESEDLIAKDDSQTQEEPLDDNELKEEEIHAANCAVPNPNLWADHPSARAILNRFVRMYPFDDGEIAECVRLEPKDIGLLPMSAWVLGNNSFLLHSYCNFRHLLFAKKLTREGCVYLLMVPGSHNNREQQLAKMFGFENFKCSRRRSMRDGEFGYWYVTIAFE